MGIFKNTQECKAPGAGKEHTNEVRGGGRDPVVKGLALASVSRQHAQNSFRAAMHFLPMIDFGLQGAPN